MFCLKTPSMLKYDQFVRSDESTVQAKSLKSLFGVKQPPSDTWLRERLDSVDPRSLRRCFKKYFFLPAARKDALRSGPCSMIII